MGRSNRRGKGNSGNGNNGRKIIPVPQPDFSKERKVPYYEYFPQWFLMNEGEAPCRFSLEKWSKTGYPVDRGGPYLQMPMKRQMKRCYTSPEAVERWATIKQKLEREAG